nr:hypothetical protein [Bradyrhizobium guangdongense]
MPGFIGPQLATLNTKAPSGSQWIREIKYDGYRVQLRIDGDERRAYTRNGYNWVSKFSRITGAFDIEGQAIVDGKVVVIHEGRTNFSEADLGRCDQDRLVYFAFDLLWLNGKDLRKEPQIERKRLLARDGAGPRPRRSARPDTVVSPKQKLTKAIRKPRPPGSNPSSTPTSNTATSPPKAFCGPVRSRA